MKDIIESWRKYSRLNERINSLNPDSGKRFIADTLTEIEEKHHNIPISPEELNKIKQWAELEGDPNFLGSGSKGSAYKFGNKVLKITSDHNEAAGASAILGKSHPNVYDIYAVAKRTKEDKQNSEGVFQKHSYIVVYEFLDYPNRLMLEATQHMNDLVRGNGEQKYYHWKRSNLNDARSLLFNLISSLDQNPNILGDPIGKYQPVKPKIKEISNKLGWSDEQTNSFMIFYGSGLDGMTAKDINTPEGIKVYTNKNLNNIKHTYFHQLALGLTFLFNNGVIFNDLKTSNIMEKNKQIAIIDIGYSEVKSDKPIPDLS